MDNSTYLADDRIPERIETRDRGHGIWTTAVHHDSHEVENKRASKKNGSYRETVPLAENDSYRETRPLAPEENDDVPEGRILISVNNLNYQNSTEQDTEKNDVSCPKKALNIFIIVLKFCCILGLLYFFVCSLNLLGSAFQLIGGRAAGGALGSSLLANPIVGLMVGVIATAVLQSSSTSTSIVVTMVAANILTVRIAVPIVMGTNIGTCVTGILVSVTQAKEREEFKRAFSAATVHDMFNWLSVMVLLPLELASGYLYHVTGAIVRSANISGGGSSPQFLNAITKPFTDLIVQIDKSVLERIAAGDEGAKNLPLLKYWCETKSVPADPTPQPRNFLLTTLQASSTSFQPSTPAAYQISTTPSPTKIIGITPCSYLFHGTTISEAGVGIILLIMSLTMLITCLILMVKILKSLLSGPLAKIIQRSINADFPGKAACFTGYVVMIVGAVATMLVQSSSVVVSTLTPLVGIGMVTVERVYPMMLGANIGTTSTAILAAFAATGARVQPSFQLALCHLFFNLTGILVWYPIPFLRRVPIGLASFLGTTTAKYRWFPILYLVTMFIIAPALIFALSLPGWYVLAAVGIPFILFLLAIGIINVIQSKRPHWLPEKLRTWEFLPEPMRSLAPMDRLVTKMIESCKCCKKCRKHPEEAGEDVPDVGVVEIRLSEDTVPEARRSLLDNGIPYPEKHLRPEEGAYNNPAFGSSNRIFESNV